MDFDTLFHKNVCAAFDRQLSLAEQIGSWSWSLETKGAAAITFTKKQMFGSKVRRSSIQILGTESEQSGTWLWGWANESDLPERALSAARQLRKVGLEHGIAAFTTPSLPLVEIDGHRLSLTAAGMFGSPGYYRCPYDGGAAFVLVEDESFFWDTENPVLRIACVFPQAAAKLSIPDHRKAFGFYAQRYGLSVTSEGDRMVGKAESGQTIVANFDAQNRCAGLSFASA